MRRIAGNPFRPLSLSVAVRVVLVAGNYIPACAQEALLFEFFGGESARELDLLTNTLRVLPSAPPATTPVPVAGPVGDEARRAQNAAGDPDPNSDSESEAPEDEGSSHDEVPHDQRPRVPAAGRPQRQRRPAAERREVLDASMLAGLISLDTVDLAATMRQRVLTLQSAPGFMRGLLRTLLRHASRLIRDARNARSSQHLAARGWKLLLLAPRMLLYRQRGQCQIPREELDRRIAQLSEGNWSQLLREAGIALVPNATPGQPRDDDQTRSERAAALAQLGEMSAAARALTAEPLAEGNEATLAELRDPARRPQEPYRQLPQDLREFLPDEPFHLSWRRFLANLRGVRRGAAAGPSGATAEHYKIMLDDEESARFLYAAARALARAEIPPEILAGIRLGRLVTLRKANGRIRGLVMGDVFRRLTARTVAQQLSEPLQQACSPFQYALSTRAGTECVARAIRAATEMDPRTTLLSIDGVGAFDHVAREGMFRGLRENPALSTALPFVRQFYGSDSLYLWYDDLGNAHEVRQAEGGEQGDPLMPGLFALAQHPALVAVQAQLHDGEAMFAFLDDIYVISLPTRTRAIFDLVQIALWEHARIEVALGKTKAWNAAGEEPPDMSDLGTDAEPCWVGGWSCPAQHRGMILLGTPLGDPAFIRRELEAKRAVQDRLLSRIPDVPDLQTAWLLLLLSANPRANYLLRVLPPVETARYAASHDNAVQVCLQRLLATDAPLQLDALQCRRTHLPMRLGGLGLRSASRLRFEAYWASWADTLPMIRERHPALAARLVQQLEAPAGEFAVPSTRQAEQAAMLLAAAGFQPPSWQELADGLRPAQERDREIGEFLRGWQRAASNCRDASDCEALLEEVDAPSRALLLSQAGTYAGRAFNLLPTAQEFRFPDAIMRTLLLRRLRVPLPLAPRHCHCRRLLDPFGDHRAACSNAGVLGPRGAPLERAAARVCREAGARVSTNVFLRDMNIDIPVVDERRIEVVANGLPLWHGVQLAVDTTLICPLGRDGAPHPRAAIEPGICLVRAQQRKRERTYPELLQARRCRLVVMGFEVGGRWSEESVDFLRRLARARARAHPLWMRQSMAQAHAYRWSGLLAAAAQRPFAASLLGLPLAGESNVDGNLPWPSDVLSDARWSFPVSDSRVV